LNNDFYYKILNIGSPNNSKEIIGEVIDDVYSEYDQKGINSEGMCKVFANIISSKLSDKKVDNRVLNLKDEYDLYEHEVVICRGIDDEKVKYYLIDFTYSQFCGKYPWNEIIKTETGKNFAYRLVKDRYLEVDDDSIIMYINSFGSDLKSFNLNNYFNDLDKKHKKK